MRSFMCMCGFDTVLKLKPSVRQEGVHAVCVGVRSFNKRGLNWSTDGLNISSFFTVDRNGNSGEVCLYWGNTDSLNVAYDSSGDFSPGARVLNTSNMGEREWAIQCMTQENMAFSVRLHLVLFQCFGFVCVPMHKYCEGGKKCSVSFQKYKSEAVTVNCVLFQREKRTPLWDILWRKQSTVCIIIHYNALNIWRSICQMCVYPCVCLCVCLFVRMWIGLDSWRTTESLQLVSWSLQMLLETKGKESVREEKNERGRERDVEADPWRKQEWFIARRSPVQYV